MLEFTESDAIERIEEIGQAFANDLNDGYGPVLYEGITFNEYDHGEGILIYNATLEDGSEVVFSWVATLISQTRKKAKNED